MLTQLIFGAIISLGNMAIHAIVTTMVVNAARRIANWQSRGSQVWVVSLMVVTAGILLAAHVAEVVTWSLAYWIVGAAPPGSNLLDFAFVNYTTLGYGDVVPVERWRLLGSMTAMNGILLFGWSTAVIYEVLRRALEMRDNTRGFERSVANPIGSK